MISTAEFELARSVRSELEQARHLLLAPTSRALEEAAPVLERSVDLLSQLEHTVRQPGEAVPGAAERLRAELRSLRHVLTGVQRLMGNAAAFHRGWAELAGAQESRYTSSGAVISYPAEVRRMAVRG